MADYQMPYPFEQRVSHYYGDQIRQIFMGLAALMLVGAPFYMDSLRGEFPFAVAGALALAAIGALANPHKRIVFVASAVAAGAGAVIYGAWALYDYHDSTWTQFVLRQAIALLFLAAFYFSVKTLRAYLMGKIGKRDEAGEFDERR